MLEKTSRFMRKHCFTDEPHCGDHLSVCNVCNQKAWLIEDIKHRSDCEVGGVLKEIRGATEVNDERKDKLIEQMREALNVLVASATKRGPLWHGSAEMQIAKAALEAAERGEL
jgi:hypothetical protein